ncbi:MAG: S8 family serine peptidase [Oscillospiraceae bacterium]|nr:S8 family serine peptidase [Oscillospiraceae bacterium]
MYIYDNYAPGKIVAALDRECAFLNPADYHGNQVLDGVDFEKVEIIFNSGESNSLNSPSDINNDDSGIGCIVLIHLKDNSKESVIAAAEKLEDNPRVVYAEPDYLYDEYIIPNDFYFDRLWGVRKIEAPNAWNYTTGNGGVVVGVTDSGINYNHEDIRKNMWKSRDNRYVNGVNFAGDGRNPDDISGHGTHVAGTIGALGNNFIGITGVCWDVKVAALRIGSGVFSLDAAIAAINFANLHKIPILNNSWGGRVYSPSLKYAIEQYNGLFVVASGNYGTNNDYIPDYPSSYDSDNIISVAASNQNDALTSFSNYGVKSVDIAAPGIDIFSLGLNDGYSYKSGTSMAAPHVAGAAALLKSYMPCLNALDIKGIILSSVKKNASLKNKISSGGVLDINAAVETADRLA